MNKLEKTLLSIATAATLAGCLGSPEPRYAGPRKHDGIARVDSSAAAQSSTAAISSPARAAYDQTRDSELNLLDADKPFLIPQEPRYTPKQEPERAPNEPAEQEYY